MFERRNQARRTVLGGIVVGALAGAVLGGLEILGVFGAARQILIVAGGFLALALPLLGLSIGLGAAAGLVEGVIVAAVSALAESLGRTRDGERRWAAALYSVALTPFVAWICAEAFSGRKAKTIPHHGLVVVVTGAVLVLLTYFGLRALIAITKRLETRRRTSTSAYVGAGLLILAAFLLAADRRLLPRIYPFFHIGLEILVFAALQLAVLAAGLSARTRGRRWGRVAAPLTASVLLIVAVGAAVLGFKRLTDVETSGLRVIAHEYGAVSSRLLDLAQWANPSDSDEQSFYESAQAAGRPTGAAPSTATSVQGPRFPGADLVLITVDALRADHLGAYGYGRPTSPRLDALAKQSVVFERAYAPVAHTSFSLASLLIGKYALSLSRLGLFTGHETIAEILRAYGYKTAGFFPPAIFYVDGERFKEYEQKRYGFEYVRFEPFKEDLDAPARTNQILSFLEAEKPARVFLWVHYFGPHEPYVDHPGPGAPPPFGAAAMDRYDGEIRWVDGEVGRLVDGIRKQRPRSIIVVTADHGEEFGEHGGAYHGTSLHDEQLRVPFIVSLPDGTPARVGGMVSTIDIMPTLLSLVDVPVSARVRGTDLSPWMQAAPPAITELPVAFAEVESLKMAAHGTEKLICDGERAYCRLFDLALDPREVKDFAAERPGRVAELKGAIGQWLGANGALERGPVASGGHNSERRALLERVRLGDKEAIPGVVALLADGTVPAADRLDGVRSLALLKDERARPGLQVAAGSLDPAQIAWGNVGLAYLKDPRAAEVCAKLDPALTKKDPLLLVHAALARAEAGDKTVAPALIEAFAATEDVELRRLVLLALGFTHDPIAKDTLFAAYPSERLRYAAASALSELKDPSTIPFLLEHLEVKKETYSSVRKVLVQGLAGFGDRRHIPSLQAAFEQYTEADATPMAAWALAKLGAVKPATDNGKPLPRPPGKKELWLVPTVAAKTPPLKVVPQQGKKALAPIVIDRESYSPAYHVTLAPEVTAVVVPVGVAALFR